MQIYSYTNKTMSNILHESPRNCWDDDDDQVSGFFFLGKKYWNLHFLVSIDVGLHGEAEHGVGGPSVHHPGRDIHIEAQRCGTAQK